MTSGQPSEPLAARIARRAEAQIREGVWPPGSRLPPERDLCRILGVGRTTLRQALDELEQLGLVTRHQGRGTFVTGPRFDADTSAHFTLSAALAAAGHVHETRVLGVETLPAGRVVAGELAVHPEDRVVRIRRLRLVRGDPVILETAVLPEQAFPGLAASDFATRSLYAILHEDFGRDVATATEMLEPVLLTAAEAALLGAPRRAPALLVRRRTEDRAGRVVEVAQALVRGDRARFLLRRRVPDDDAVLAWPPGPPAIELVTHEPAPVR